MYRQLDTPAKARRHMRHIVKTAARDFFTHEMPNQSVPELIKYATFTIGPDDNGRYKEVYRMAIDF